MLELTRGYAVQPQTSLCLFLRYEVKPHNYLLYYFFWVNAPRSNAQQQQYCTDCGKNLFHSQLASYFKISTKQ